MTIFCPAVASFSSSPNEECHNKMKRRRRKNICKRRCGNNFNVLRNEEDLFIDISRWPRSIRPRNSASKRKKKNEDVFRGENIFCLLRGVNEQSKAVWRRSGEKNPSSSRGLTPGFIHRCRSLSDRSTLRRPRSQRQRQKQPNERTRRRRNKTKVVVLSHYSTCFPSCQDVWWPFSSEYGVWELPRPKQSAELREKNAHSFPTPTVGWLGSKDKYALFESPRLTNRFADVPKNRRWRQTRIFDSLNNRL